MRRTLPTIVIAQFLCTSVWFAGNAVLPQLILELGFEESMLGHLSSAVQLGFITGTLLFAIFAIADRVSPTLVFLCCGLLAATSNFLPLLLLPTGNELLVSRFVTGFFLAGIYPVGMKIASDHFREGLGRSLGFLVGALVLGTALPHLIRSMGAGLDWKLVLGSTSLLAVAGGVMLFVGVPNGPYRKISAKFDSTAFMNIFKVKPFRKAALGYFGHMWELYAFWAFVPWILYQYQSIHERDLPVSFSSFIIIGSGGLACVASGWFSSRAGTQKLAMLCLLASGICCLLSPLFFYQEHPMVLLGFLWFWGLVVIADSPLFSTLVAQHAPAEIKGTALTIVNCIGFAITVVSIQLIQYLTLWIPSGYVLMLLAIGPVFGVLQLGVQKNTVKEKSSTVG
jgi:MFS family permease